MFAGLTSAFTDIHTFGKDGYAERDVYADFLDEAALALDNPVLRQAAEIFRQSAIAWGKLGEVLLPDEIAPFGEARRLILERHRIFLEQGGAGREQMLALDARLQEIRARMENHFPLDEAGATAFRERLAGAVEQVLEVETRAVGVLKEAIAG
jgi:hypothetical protein